MRKLFNFFAAALVMLAAASCEKNEILAGGAEGKVVTLSAVIDNGGTKTSLGGLEDEIYPVLWSADDAIAVINNGKLFKFVLDAEDAGTTQGTFTCAEGDGFDETMSVQAFYPYEGVTYDAGAISYTVPATQAYATTDVDEVTCSTFGNGASPMAAYRAAGATSALTFDNLFGVLKLKLKRKGTNNNEKVFGIEIISSNSLKGNATLTITDASNSIYFESLESSDDKKVTLICKEGVLLNSDTPTDFLVALPAGATNLRVLIHTNLGSYSKDIPASNSIVAGQIRLMPELILGTNVAPIIYMENGASLGNGIAIPNSDGKFNVWAPVNCGYEPANGSYKGYPYGKLYQWGRKEGQGYYMSGSNYESFNDGSYPGIEEGPVTWNEYVTRNFSNVFIKVTGQTGDWLSPQKPDLWGNGTKTEYDPCPAGWRVPTIDELNDLTEHSQYKSAGYAYWFSGNNPCDGNYPRISLQYRTGYHAFNLEEGSNRGGDQGYYWSSTTDGTNSKYIYISKTYTSNYPVYRKVYSTQRANAYVIRCIMEEPLS